MALPRILLSEGERPDLLHQTDDNVELEKVFDGEGLHIPTDGNVELQKELEGERLDLHITTDGNVALEKEHRGGSDLFTPTDDDQRPDLHTPTDGNMELDKELDSEISNPPTPTDDYVEFEKELETEGAVKLDEDISGDESNNAIMYKYFFDDLEQCELLNVLEFIKQHPEAAGTRHPTDSSTALHRAVCNKEVHFVKELVQLMADEDLEILTDSGKTALHLAIDAKNSEKMVEIAKCMVEKNKKLVTIVDSDYETPLVYAFQSKKMKLAQYLFSVSPPEIQEAVKGLGFREKSNVKSENEVEIEEAVEVSESSNAKTYKDFFNDLDDDKFDVAMEFIKQRPEAVRARDPDGGETALHKAVWSKKVDIVKELVRLMTEDDLLIQTDKGETALDCAIQRKDSKKMIQIAKCMVEKNKNLLTVLNSKSKTPLIVALSWLRIEMANYLYCVSPVEVREAAERKGFKITSIGFLNFEEKTCNWDDAVKFIGQFPEAVRARHPSTKFTILHYAINQLKLHIAEELVQLMTADDLAVRDDFGNTALLAIALTENASDDLIKLAKCMVEKNRKLLTMVNYVTQTPLVAAFQLCNWKLADYFYSVTPFKSIKDTDAALIICQGLRDKKLDIPWDLIQHTPSLALTEAHTGQCPLGELAGIPSAFLSGSRLSFWERWVYDCIYIKPTPTIDSKKKPVKEIRTDVKKLENEHRGHGMLLFRSGFDRIYQIKLLHSRVLEFLHCMCKWIKVTDEKRIQKDLLQEAVSRAVERGHVEFVTQIIRVNPDILRQITDENRKSALHFAAECRQEKVYSLIHGFSALEKGVIGKEFADHLEVDNIVLAISNFPAVAEDNSIRGPALRMQRELQWLKEVENIAGHVYLEAVLKENKTPRELFTETHRRLVKEGEKSMKETATSCAVVGALVITMMFAAAFTVPGGNNGDIGTPIFLEKKAFKIFMVSDAISLFSSTTSVMIFLGILTSRFAEDDFLKSLPRKMILGLLTLFLSISAMMIAFSSALFLMLPEESWIAVPATVLSGIPMASFMWMQLPFLIEIFISTYGAGPFDRNVDSWTDCIES